MKKKLVNEYNNEATKYETIRFGIVVRTTIPIIEKIEKIADKILPILFSENIFFKVKKLS